MLFPLFNTYITWHAVMTDTVLFEEINFFSRPESTSYVDDGKVVSKTAGWHDLPSSGSKALLEQHAWLEYSKDQSI